MKLAMWLLRRFGVLQKNESLIGDLIEERAAGRSALWLWRQTAAAIAGILIRDLRDHWVLALRAIAIGWAGSFLFAFILVRLPLVGWWWGNPVLASRLADAALLLWPAALGWIVAQTHGTHRAAMVLAFAASVAVSAPWVCVQCVPPAHGDPGLMFGSNVIAVLVGGLLPGPRRKTC